MAAEYHDISIPHKIDLGFIDTTISPCVKELVEGSYRIYNDLLNKGIEITLICGGQSPSYYCLSMMNLPCYDPSRVGIIIIPHSKGGVVSGDQEEENRLYCERLKEKDILLRRNVTILDGVHSGVGVIALESALKSCYPGIIIEKIAINVRPGISKISVDKEYYFKCEPKFSDVYPRLVNSYHPRDFNNPLKFIVNEFNISDNPLAQMIIGVSREYPMIQIEDTEWFRLNTEALSEIELHKIELSKIVNIADKKRYVTDLYVKGKLLSGLYFELSSYIKTLSSEQKYLKYKMKYLQLKNNI